MLECLANAGILKGGIAELGESAREFVAFEGEGALIRFDAGEIHAEGVDVVRSETGSRVIETVISAGDIAKKARASGKGPLRSVKAPTWTSTRPEAGSPS